MRINNLHLTSVTFGKTGEASAPSEFGRREGPDRPTVESSFHTPSAELARWLEMVQKEPEVRPEVLAKIAKNLDAGIYLNSTSADLTAASLLRASE